MRPLLILVMLLGLGACAGTDGTSVPATGVGENVAKAGASEIRSAYEDYWVQLVDALDPPDPRHEGLLGRVAGDERQRARQLVLLRKRAGEAVRGRYEHDVDLGEHDDDRASLTDCLTLRTTVVDAGSGKRIRGDVPGPHPVAVELEHRDDTWRVTRISSASHACPRPPSGASQGATEQDEK